MTPKYSIWKIVHESFHTVTAFKFKDTNSIKELEKYQRMGFATSYYYDCPEINAERLQTFNEVY